MGRLLELEKALGYDEHHHQQNRMDSLEQKVSVFLDQDFDHQISDDCSDLTTDSFDSMERILYWESQEALLQEILERYSLTGSKLRQEIIRIIKMAKETDFCSCPKPSSDGCIYCLRQRVVNLLLEKGFNATLCTSKWKSTKKFPGGTHEYVKVQVSTQGKKKQVPLVIELEFRDQFEIAKACDEYQELVEQLPEYFIGKCDYLNAIVRVVCDAAKRSMKEKKIHMGPWRKRSFMQMKWSNSIERSSFDESSSSANSSLSARQVHHHFLTAAPSLVVT